MFGINLLNPILIFPELHFQLFDDHTFFAGNNQLYQIDHIGIPFDKKSLLQIESIEFVKKETAPNKIL